MKLNTLKCLNCTHLKYIALITMILDHFACIFLQSNLYGIPTPKQADYLYEVFRCIGRTSFPIFSFLIIEGKKHTSNIRKYLLRLLLYAIFAEIPYDYGIYGCMFKFEHQNVCFTFFLGCSLLCLYDYLDNLHVVTSILLKLASTLIIMVITEILGCDYSYIGILVLIILYLNEDKIIGIIISILCLIILMDSEIFAILSIVPILMYNGKRGNYNKYLFYIVYPFHLMIFRIFHILI